MTVRRPVGTMRRPVGTIAMRGAEGRCANGRVLDEIDSLFDNVTPEELQPPTTAVQPSISDVAEPAGQSEQQADADRQKAHGRERRPASHHVEQRAAEQQPQRLKPDHDHA